MVSYSQLLHMDLARLRTAAANAGGLSSSLSSRGTEVASKAQIPGGMWSGDDANAGSSLLSPQASPLWDASDAFSGGQAILQDLATSLDSAKQRLGDAQDAVAGTKAYIDSDGTVVVPPGLDDTENARATNAAQQARDLIDEALENATSSDTQASSALAGHMGNVAFLPVMPLPKPPINPEQLRGMGQRGVELLGRIGEFVKNNSTVGGPSVGHDVKNGPSRTGKSKGRGTSSKRSGTDGKREHTTNWRLFEAQFHPRAESGNLFAGLDVGAGIKGAVGAMNSIDAAVGASAGAGVEASQAAGPVTFNGTAGVQAGASAGLGGEIGVEDGKLRAGAGAKATVGAGLNLGGSVEIDLTKIVPWD